MRPTPDNASILEMLVTLTDARIAQDLTALFPTQREEALRSWLRDALKIDPTERWTAIRLKTGHSLFGQTQATFNLHDLATKSDVKEILVAVKELSEMTKHQFESLDHKMATASIEAALENSQYLQGLGDLQLMLQQQKEQGAFEFSEIHRALGSLGPDIAASVSEMISEQGDPEMNVKMDKLMGMMGTMQTQISSISKGVDDLKKLTSIVEARSNNWPTSYVIKPLPKFEKLTENAGLFDQMSNMIKRKIIEPGQNLAWERSILCFVCPITLKEVSCGPGGHGYPVSIPTALLKTVVPALKVPNTTTFFIF